MNRHAVRVRPQTSHLAIFVVGLTLLLGGCAELFGEDEANNGIQPSSDAGADVSDQDAVDATQDSGSCSPSVQKGRQVIADNCTTCHSESLTGTQRQAAPTGLNFDDEDDHRLWADRIEARAIDQRTMPAGSPLSDCEAASLQAYLDDITAGDCTPVCDGRSCGRDGCGGSCGSCGDAETCEPYTGTCKDGACEPDCSGKQCGDDGCGGSCGSCGADETCNAGECECTPDCSGKECGPDGCGGSCGSCAGELTCNTTQGTCVDTCQPDCSNKDCGDDGCGGSCGTCGADEQCDSSGMCVCAPQCSGKECGPDGCGGSCGTCSSSQTCETDTCVYDDVSYATEVYPIFDSAGCGSNTCHGGPRPQAGLDMTSASAAYTGMVGVSSSQCGSRLIVDPGAPGSSYLLDKLRGTNLCFGSQMPKGATPLPTSEINTIEAWIANGAPDN